jgi:hypothetical protein
MTDNNIEADRNRALADLLEASQDQDPKASLEFRYGPASFGCQEALHTAHILLGLMDRELVGHPSIILEPEWYARARRVQDELWSLYQKIGAAHVPDTDPKAAH